MVPQAKFLEMHCAFWWSRDALELRKQDLRSKIAQGLQSLRRGDVVDGNEFFAQLEKEENELANQPGRRDRSYALARSWCSSKRHIIRTPL